jgi:hypothetical protein
MTPTFYIAHSTPGRTRIRWAGDASEKNCITALATEIENLNGVVKAVPRITTGSIIIEHDEKEWPGLQTELNNKLSLNFTFTSPAMQRSGVESLNQGLDNLDGALKKVNMDFDSVTMLMLSALAIIQALRGQVMSSSVSFLWYAFTLSMMARGKADNFRDDSPDTTE